jgi:hypothetical protein
VLLSAAQLQCPEVYFRVKQALDTRHCLVISFSHHRARSAHSRAAASKVGQLKVRFDILPVEIFHLRPISCDEIKYCLHDSNHQPHHFLKPTNHHHNQWVIKAGGNYLTPPKAPHTRTHGPTNLHNRAYLSQVSF